MQVSYTLRLTMSTKPHTLIFLPKKWAMYSHAQLHKRSHLNALLVDDCCSVKVDLETFYPVLLQSVQTANTAYIQYLT